MATVTREREELIEELKRASMAVFAGFEYEVAKDLSRLYREAAAALAAPPASDPPGLYRQGQEDMRRRVLDIVRDPSDCHIVKKLPVWGVPGMAEAAAAVAPLVERAQQATGGSDASDFRMRQSDPPGLVELVREYQAIINGYGDGEQNLQELDGRLAVVQEQLLAYPLPASPQAETKGDE